MKAEHLPVLKRSWIDFVFLSVTLLLCLYITAAIGLKSYDDAYITFRYVENLKNGLGFAYNPGEPLLATTTPLLTLVLAGLSKVFPSASVPEIAQWLTGLSLFALSFLVYRIGKENDQPVAGWTAGLLTVLNPVFPPIWGGESILLLTIATGSFYSWFRGYPGTAGFLVGLAYLTRGEGILIATVLAGSWFVTRRSLPLRLLLTASGVVLSWSAYSFLTFGSPFPASLSAKQAQMASGEWTSFVSSCCVTVQRLVGSPDRPGIGINPGYSILMILSLVGALHILTQSRRNKEWLLIGLWIMLYTAGYSAIGIPFYFWYFSPLYFGIVTTAAVGSHLLFTLANAQLEDASRWRQWTLRAVAAALVVLPVSAGAADALALCRRPVSRLQNLYTNAGLWLNENTPAESTVGFFEIGFVGYWSQRAMVDPVGLVNEGVPDRVAEADFFWAYQHFRPDYILINRERWYDKLGRIREEAWFEKAYDEVAFLEEPGYFDSPIVVYKKIDASFIPLR